MLNIQFDPSLVSVRALAGQTSGSSAETLNGDGFSAIFEQLLMALPKDAYGPVTLYDGQGIVRGGVNGQSEETQGEKSEEMDDALMQMIGEMLQTNPMLALQFPALQPLIQQQGQSIENVPLQETTVPNLQEAVALPQPQQREEAIPVPVQNDNPENAEQPVSDPPVSEHEFKFMGAPVGQKAMLFAPDLANQSEAASEIQPPSEFQFMGAPVGQKEAIFDESAAHVETTGLTQDEQSTVLPVTQNHVQPSEASPAFGLSQKAKQTQTIPVQHPVLTEEKAEKPASNLASSVPSSELPAPASNLKEAVSVQNQYYHSIREAHSMLRSHAESAVSEKEQPVNVDALQEQVASNRFVPSAVVKTGEPVEPKEAPDLATQIREGMKENLTAGKNEFQLKLKPEGLGEITVRLMEKGGKTTLSLTTASAEVAKLLNSELSSLREALRPLHVQVNDAVPQQQYTQEHQASTPIAQQFHEFGQQQNPENRHPSGGHETHSSNGVLDFLNEEDIQEGEASMIDTALDMYI